MRNELRSVPLTILTGDSLCDDQVSLQGMLLVGIVVPATFDGTKLTFQVGADPGATFYNFYKDDGTEFQMTVAASSHVRVIPEDFAGVFYLRVRAGTSGAPSVQSGSDTILTLVLRPV